MGASSGAGSDTAPAEADVTGVGYLVGVEAGVLGLEVDD
jgi:hypothetical protein